MMDDGNWYLERIRAASIAPAIPEALSLAPGESEIPLFGSETRESISPLITTNRLGSA